MRAVTKFLMNISATQRRSLMSFVVIAVFGIGMALFIIQKGNEAIREIDSLNNGPLALRRAALAQELGNDKTASSTFIK